MHTKLSFFNIFGSETNSMFYSIKIAGAGVWYSRQCVLWRSALISTDRLDRFWDNGVFCCDMSNWVRLWNKLKGKYEFGDSQSPGGPESVRRRHRRCIWHHVRYVREFGRVIPLKTGAATSHNCLTKGKTKAHKRLKSKAQEIDPDRGSRLFFEPPRPNT